MPGDPVNLTVKFNHQRCYNAFQNNINMCQIKTSLVFDVTYVQNKPSGYQLIIQDDTASKAPPNIWIVTNA